MRVATCWTTFGLLAVAAAWPVADAPPASAAPPTAPAVADGPPSPEVAALIADLGSADYRAREKAGRAIEQLGDKVLPDLRRALASAADPEVNRRLAVMVRRMDYDRLVSSRKVTLSVKDQPAKAVFDEVAKQTGYKIEVQGELGSGKYSFDFDKAPFWVAMDRIAEQVGVGFYQDSEDQAVRVNVGQDAHNPYTAYAGPFRVVANGINSNKNVQLSGVGRQGFGARPQESINLNFQVHSEPKNPILSALQAEVVSAVDDTGASLIPPKDNNVYYGRSYYHNPGYQGFQTNGNLNLVRASREATKIKSVKGKIPIVLLAGSVPEIVIADPVKVKDKKVVGRTVEVEYASMTEANGQYTVNLTARKLGPQNPNNFDWNWSHSLWQKLEVVDAKGKRYSGSPTQINNNGMTVQLTVVFGMDRRRGTAEKIPQPVKFVVNEWLQITHEVSFEFKDVPLP